MRVRALWVVMAAAACGPAAPAVDAGPQPLADAGPMMVTCNAGLTACADGCHDLHRDYLNCGGCGQACQGALSCVGGNCVEGCPAGQRLCGGLCLEVAADPMNCGGCGVTCRADQTCRQGTCQCTSTVLHECGGACVDLDHDEGHCGSCAVSCEASQRCVGGQCDVVCDAGTWCGAAPGSCHDLQTELTDCGACGRACNAGDVCVHGACGCPANTVRCNGTCLSLLSDPDNCGGCGISCGNQQCYLGTCLSACPPGQTRCGLLCVDTASDIAHCGACFHACTGDTTCGSGQCSPCDSATTDCDHDGWLVSQGDCCDTPSGCTVNPAMVNPGAMEIGGNGVDDNCNGLLDSADLADLSPCDAPVPASQPDAGEFARAMDLCRTTVEVPATAQLKTWGLISAELLRADGSPLAFPDAASIRTTFGSQLLPQQGTRFAVLSTGLAADATQTNPGPNGGPALEPSDDHGLDAVNFSTCNSPDCIKDWYVAARPPLKLPNALPIAAACGPGLGASSFPDVANDSVMLKLRLRAPTNARAFQFKALFLSAEYPEYVCSAFNDQLVALVSTPAGTPDVPNPSDKNLMTSVQAGQAWPVGINVAAGTDLFARCKPKASDPCWQPTVAALSCSLGDATLAGTGFDAPPGPQMCTTGGGTRWLVTTGNVVPGQIVELRIAIWDVDDDMLDSVALLDGFRWLTNPASAGTD